MLTANEALVILETLLPPGSLNQAGRLVFQQAWEGKSYADIAEDAGYDTDYIKVVASRLWKSISAVLKEKVSKTNFRPLLIQRLAALAPGEIECTEAIVISTPTNRHLQCRRTTLTDWGEAPDVSMFYGRMDELAELKCYALTEDCRLVALLGMGGIGKTALVTKLAQVIQDQYDFVIWRSLRNMPTADDLLAELVMFLSNQHTGQPTTHQFIQCLRKARCLLVFDNIESILQPGPVGYYCPGYEDYGNLFRLVGETAHQSCLLLTSREKPPEVAELEGMELVVRSVSIQGSPEVATALINAKGIVSTPVQQEKLGHYYGYSPLALKIVASSIHDLFDGNLETFLDQETIAFNGIRRLLNQQFRRLTDVERTILNWLAINREWTTIAELQQDIVPAISCASLLESLESLTWRSLIEKKTGRDRPSGQYTLQPVVMEYVTDNLLDQVFQDLVPPEAAEPGPQGVATQPALQCYALLKTTVKDYVRESQQRLLLEPLAQRLRDTFPSAQALAQQLQGVLRQFRTRPAPSYGPGNVLNLCQHLQHDLAGYDFSHLPIWQADLREVALPQVNFSQADFQHTVFTQSLCGVQKVAYSPSGEFLATMDTSGSIRLWRVADGQLHQSCEGHQYWGWALAFSPDGQRLASGGEDCRVRVWDGRTGQCVQSLQLDVGVVWSVSFSPDGQTLAIGSNLPDILLWEIEGHQSPQILTGHTSDIRSLQFSPDGQFLASASHDHTIRLWDLCTRQCQQTLVGHTERVTTITFSHAGQRLASGSADQTIRLWSLDTGQCQAFVAHDSIVSAVVFSPDGERLVSSSEDRSVKLWNLHGQCLKTLLGHQEWVWTVAVSPDGQTLASGSGDQTVRFWHGQTGQCLQTLSGHIDYPSALAWHPGGQTLVTGSANRTLRLWDGKTCTRTWQAHENWVWSAAFSAEGQLASGSTAVKLWNIETGAHLGTVQTDTGFVFGLAWSPDNTALATGSADTVVRVWEVKNNQCLHMLAGHEHWVAQVAWCPDGQQLASCSGDGTVKIWDLATETCLQTLKESAWIWSVVWSPDRSLLAYSTADGFIKLCDTTTWTLLTTLAGHTAQVTRLGFSPCGTLLASGSYDCTVKLWNLETRQCQNTLTGHTQLITNLAFNPTRSEQGQLLASTSEDGTLRLWDISTGDCLQTLRPERLYEGMNISGATGLTSAQKNSLINFGAAEC